jgi:hypothetical protein
MWIIGLCVIVFRYSGLITNACSSSPREQIVGEQIVGERIVGEQIVGERIVGENFVSGN